MSIRQTCVKTVQIQETLNNINAKLIYPKIAIVEDYKSVRILDCNDETQNQDFVYNLDDTIVHHVVYHDMLWLAFKFGKISVINPKTNTVIAVENSNNVHFIFHHFLLYENKLYLTTESGECVHIPVAREDLNQKFDAGVLSLNVSYDKVHLPRNKNTLPYTTCNGMDLYIDSGNIVLKCPITGLFEVLTCNSELKYISSWNEKIVVSSEKRMCLIDNKTFDTIYTFDDSGYKYQPLAEHNNGYYYLMWNEQMIQICYASFASNDIQFEEIYSSSEKKSSSQDTLVKKLQALINELILSKQPKPEVLPQLQTYFNEILDLVFLIDSAIQLCNHSISYKSVLYQVQKRIFAINDTNHIKKICDIMIKVDLLEYLLFKGNKGYEDLNIFEKNFVQLCSLFVSKSDMDLASICWLKYSEMKHAINCDDIINILNAVPHNIKMSALMVWFRNFVPALLEQNPFHIDVFVKWTTDRVFLLEQSSYWPKIGLKFIMSIVEILEGSMKTINVRPISLDDLDSLNNHINYISELKEKYKINMLLSEFTSLSPTEVALIMLRRCYTEDLELFLQDNLTCYATRYLFEIDDTLRSFIESETASSGGSVDGLRLQILLNAFHSPSNRLETLLQVLKVLDVPWNPTVLNLATEAALLVNTDFTITDTDKVLAQEIHKELNYSKIKVILKKYNFPLTCTDYTLVIHKLINASEVDLDDLMVVTNIMSSYTNYANTLFIDRCLRDCDTKNALNYFKNLSNRNKRILIKTIENKYEQIITGVTSDPIIERNYVDFLKGSNLLHKNQIKYMENLYHLKNSYGIKMNCNDMYSEKSRIREIQAWQKNEGNITSSSKGRCVMELIAEDNAHNSKLTSLLRRASTNHEIRNIIEHLLFSNLFGENTRSVLSLYKDGDKSELLLESHNILSEIVSVCDEESLHYLLENLSQLNALINAHYILKNLSVAWKFHYIYLPMTSINTLNELINFYVKSATGNVTECDWTNIFNSSDFVPFRIMANIAQVSINVLGHSHLLEIIEKFTKKILAKILSSQELDLILVTALLLVLQGTQIADDEMWILDLLRGPSDSLSPSIMNYLACPTIRKTFSLENVLPNNMMSYPPQYILKSKFNINLDEISLPETSEETWDVKILLFNILRNLPDISFERLIDLCHTLNVSESDGLSLLLISLLTNWELKYKILVNDIGYRDIYLENHEEDLLVKCDVIWQNIENKEFLRDILNDFWKNGEVILHGCLVSINPYYYEVYLCVFKLLFSSSPESRNMKEYYLLHFLKQYKRKSPPKQYEFELFSVKGMFPEIGHYRLPFHLFMRDDKWSNLKSEITLESYETWLPVVSLLSLDADLQTAKDMICSNAVKQTMTTRKRKDSTEVELKDNEPWRLTTREEPLLRTAHRCVRHIANMEWAGACLFYVLQGCARGADQVAAAQLCYQFSQRWASLQPGNRAVKQMERLHSTLSTRHALHKIEWACEDLLRLVTEPAQLIHALYLHPNFLEKIARYDINRVANEVADKNGINISSIRIQILENILTKSNKEQKSLAGLDMRDLIRAKYILKATCPKMGAIYLSRIAFDEESEYNKCKKLRALQCLMSIIEPENALKVTNRSRDVLWTSLLELLYTVNLERIDVPWIIATLVQNKQQAINQLIQTSSGNIDCLKIAADIAHRYGDAQIIREIIPLMLRHGIYDEMIPLLLKALYPPDKIIYTAWRWVILTPFQRADYPITERQRTKCLNALNLLPVCPVIKDEDLLEIWKNCIRCKCIGIGCLILPYMTTQTRQSLAELHKIDKRNLIISLKNLHAESYLVSGAMHVLESLTTKVHR